MQARRARSQLRRRLVVETYEALELIGIKAGLTRLPVGPMRPEKREELYKVLIGMGLPAKI
ncbi:MAG TPA: hypothetical protein PLI88_01130 [Bacillota bacterium]|nr:hypothetical protein [Bacillota bacterium]HOH09852.1 hypothetical protein [Bacillota bacterium]HOY88219.1 hypothetical protein [Bacillota bacterium]HPI00735.1 hypothetical protein [Bacillota bacterium]HPM64232.1 hypothetical protein [Bacillota bacterium]